MPKRRKALTAALLAVFSLALGASAGSAMAAKFAAAGYPAALSGSQTTEHVFSTNGGQFKCQTATLSGNLAGEAETWVATPTYANCKRGAEAATVNRNGCTYTLSAGVWKGGGESLGAMKINCGIGNDIVLTQGGCEVKVHPTPEWVIFNRFNNGVFDFNVTFETEFEYTLNNGCGFAAGKYVNGTLTGTSTVKGNTGAVQVGP